MRVETYLKLGQAAGVLALCAGVVAHVWGYDMASPRLFLLGGLAYGGCRFALWLRAK